MTASADCVECRAAFEYDAEFFAKRRLRAPVRCPACRAVRRARRITLRGVIERTGPRRVKRRPTPQGFAFVATDDGRRFWVSPSRPWHRPGLPVAFSIDPEEAPPPGRLPRAYAVLPGPPTPPATPT